MGIEIDPQSYFSKLLRLLELEAEAEKQDMLRLMQLRTPEQAEASGASLVNLVAREEDAGLGGRVLLTLGKRSQGAELPWHRLNVGTPVLLSEEATSSRPRNAFQGWRGVVSQTRRDTIQVALADWPETDSERPAFRLDRANDETARLRLRQALQHARDTHQGRLAELRAILLGAQPPAFESSPALEPLDESLNSTQLEAVRFALSAKDLAIIHGPPGTGKTTTVVEVIRQLIHQGHKVLACAPSNLAVDNMLERLLAGGEEAIRLGHPARVLPELRAHTLDLMVQNHPEVRLAHKLARQAHDLRRQAGKYTRAAPERGARQRMREEARQMLSEARQIENQVVEHLIDSAQVVCATLTGLDRDLLGSRQFDWCVVDEAGQSTEPAMWIPLLRSERLILAGDPFQLPPTVISPEAAAAGLNISMLERLMDQLGPSISRRLEVQYRMHQEIMQFSSSEFYEGSQVADSSVRSHLLQDLPGVNDGRLTGSAVEFIDTAGASYDEALEPDGESRLNPDEAALVVHKVQQLLAAGVLPGQIAVITPYGAQVRLLRAQKLPPEVEIDSVDGFQGREKEAVVVSLVRSNRDGEIGFLGDIRRMNVALTRARRKLLVIGDSATITNHPFYQRLVDYFELIGAYKSVWEEDL